MAKGKSGSDGKGKKERMQNYRKTRASQRQPFRVTSQEEAGTPF